MVSFFLTRPCTRPGKTIRIGCGDVVCQAALTYLIYRGTHTKGLAVYDMLGREVCRLVDGVQPAGTYEVRFDASTLPNGMYLYRMDIPEQSITKTLLLVK